MFDVIEGGAAPKPHRRTQKDLGYAWECPHCRSATVMPVKTGPRISKGKLRGGVSQWVCVQCLAQGRVTVVPAS